MKIDWNNLKKPNYIVDYYAITLREGKVERTKVYYLIDKQSITKVGNSCIDRLLSENYLKAFSLGLGDGKCKYDFSVINKSDTILKTLATEFEYLDLNILKIFERCLNEHKILYANHVVGTKCEQCDKKNIFSNICLYYRFEQYVKLFIEKSIVHDLFATFGYNNLFFVYPQNENCWLHMFGLDFSENLFKFKLYFQFNKEFCTASLSEMFEHDINCNVVKHFTDINGYLEMLQIAISSKNEVSYNFYFKEDCLIGQ